MSTHIEMVHLNIWGKVGSRLEKNIVEMASVDPILPGFYSGETYD